MRPSIVELASAVFVSVYALGALVKALGLSAVLLAGLVAAGLLGWAIGAAGRE